MSRRVRGTCGGCGRERSLHARGLCAGCYQTPAVRAAAPCRPAGRPPKVGGAACAACGQFRVTVRGGRGLCRTCHAVVGVRESVPDRREKPVRGTAAARNAVVTDPEVCPPTAVVGAARKVCAQFGRPDLLDDLTQVGWLTLLRAAGLWESGGGCPFLGYAWARMLGRMREYARRNTRIRSLGAAGTDFDCPDRPHPEPA